MAGSVLTTFSSGEPLLTRAASGKFCSKVKTLPMKEMTNSANPAVDDLRIASSSSSESSAS